MVLLSGSLTRPRWATLETSAQADLELKGEFDSNALNQGCPSSVLPKDIQVLLTSGADIGAGDNLRISEAVEKYRTDMTARIDRECGLNLPG